MDELIVYKKNLMQPPHNVIGWIEIPVRNMVPILDSEGNRNALHSRK